MARDVPVADKPKASRFKKFLWSLLVVVLAIGGAYFAGWFQTRSQITGLDQQLSSARELLASAEQRADGQRHQLTELEARRRIHLAIINFDQNNFGTAQSELRAAATLLEATPGNVELAALARSLRTLELAPSLDLGAQRGALLQLAAKFDALRPPMPVSP
jgi:hypothetical protein